MRAAGVVALALLMLAQDAAAAELPTKAPPPAAVYDWTGLHLGAHLDYAGGSSRWSSTQAGLPGPSGSLGFTNAYNFSTGTGSYLVGLQAGYDYMLPSRWVLGVEADVSFPSAVGGDRIFSSAATGQADYLESVQLSGSVRGRIGYAPELARSHWLIYATGGFAWSYDQFVRIQLAGGTAAAGTIESTSLVPRAGGTIGGGVELALTPNWAARAEYLLTDYGKRAVMFPVSAQRFDSDLMLHTFRAGLDYKLGQNDSITDFLAKGPSALELDRFAFHGETAFIEQYAFPFRSPYLGAHSLSPNQGRESWEAMFFIGTRLWDGAELWVDPEIEQGFGLSNDLGVAGYPNGDATKVGSGIPYARIQRAFVRQTIDLGGQTRKVEADQNQFAGSQTADRLVIWVGKYAVVDIFDKNKYAGDPRKDFLNFALIDAGTFDFVADAWSFTYGTAVEWYQGDWTLRAGAFDAPLAPADPDLDTSLKQFQWVGEIERRWKLWSNPGKIAVTGFVTRAKLGSYTDAVALAAEIGGPADTAAVRQYRSRTGVSMNIEQQISEELGVFVRAGLANGAIEPDAYTDIDRTIAAGFQLTGKQWGRPNDTLGIGGIVNGISSSHQAYFNAGGLGIEIGDGMLPHPGLEKILETYYLFPVANWQVSFDYQFIANPAYNRDRGPVSVVAARVHTQF